LERCGQWSCQWVHVTTAACPHQCRSDGRHRVHFGRVELCWQPLARMSDEDTAPSRRRHGAGAATAGKHSRRRMRAGQLWACSSADRAGGRRRGGGGSKGRATARPAARQPPVGSRHTSFPRTAKGRSSTDPRWLPRKKPLSTGCAVHSSVAAVERWWRPAADVWPCQTQWWT